MVVSAIGRAESVAQGVQPFEPRRHLRQVAELVGRVFADEMDAEGRSALRELQWASRITPFLGDLWSQLYFQDAVSGFVWVEEGRVIGNVTFQRDDWSGMRWRISNVAVAPEYRGHGIARVLLRPALTAMTQWGAGWAILQVRVDNQAARRVYQELGFTDVCREGIWKLNGRPPRPPADLPVTLQRLPALAWEARHALAKAARSPLAEWLQPLGQEGYRMGLSRLAGETLGRLTGLYRVERWGLARAGLLLGAVEARMDEVGGVGSLRFDVHPQARGELEAALVARGLAYLAGGLPAAITAWHSADHAEGVAAVEAAGFRAERVLLTMRREITAADATRAESDTPRRSCSIKGGNMATQSRDVRDFDEVLLTGQGDIILEQGDAETLEIEADESVLSNIKAEVHEGRLVLGYEHWWKQWLHPLAAIRYRLTMKTVKGSRSRAAATYRPAHSKLTSCSCV